MKTEQIRLIQDTYTVPAEVGGYLVTCPGCGARINLYDMYHGIPFHFQYKLYRNKIFLSVNRIPLP